MDQSFDLVIFDCDGVLVDSEKISARILTSALDDLGLSIDMGYFQQNFVGRSFPTVAASIRQTFKIDLPSNFEATYRSRLLEAFTAELAPTKGIKEVLEALQVRKCVATSSSPARSRHSLTLTGLWDHFDGKVFTASEVEHGKPAPDLFLYAASKMNLRPDRCLVIEDSLPGIEAGLAAGMHVLRYVGGSHLAKSDREKWGLDPRVGILEHWLAFFEAVPSLG